MREEEQSKSMRTYQLRRYVVNLGELDAFVDEWVREVVPLRERFGFRVEGAWIVRDEHRFIWLVSYDGEDGFEAASERYFRSPARTALQPDPARLLAETETTLMEPVVERVEPGEA
jgi:hypothetical protein